MARPRHEPDPVLRRQVGALAGYGVPELEIAGMMGIDPKTLRKHYRQELDHGHTKANAKVAENLFRKATGEGREAVTAAIFWLKTRAGWKETSVHEHGGVPHNPITEVRRIILAPPDPARIGRSSPREQDSAGSVVLVTGVQRDGDSPSPSFGSNE